MGILIDSSILISAERSRLNIERHIVGASDEQFYLSVVSASELLHGAHRAVDPVIKNRRLAFVEAILSRFPILEIDLATARIHAKIWAELTVEGDMIGPHDCWIAAAAVAHGLRLATSNIREFGRVPGLIVENWN